MHVVTLTYTADLREVDAAMDDHRAWLDHGLADGFLLAAGPREPRTGGVLLVADVAREEVDVRLALDPFAVRGLATYDVVTFRATRVAAGLQGLTED